MINSVLEEEKHFPFHLKIFVNVFDEFVLPSLQSFAPVSEEGVGKKLRKMPAFYFLICK